MSDSRSAALPPDDDHIASVSPRLLRVLSAAIVLAFLAFITFWTLQRPASDPFNSQEFLAALGIGILAQLVDGALGMAYGVTANSLLLATGLAPAAATTTVHVSEAFTTAASGLSHWRLGNIDKRLFGRIVIPGVIGGVIGVLVVTAIDGQVLRPWIAAYLLVMGLYILYRAFRIVAFRNTFGRKLTPIALIGGFADSVGGGGWGPVVTTTLIGSGHEPRTTIGSVNSAEFFVTLASGFSFTLLIGIQHWESVAGLVLGGLLVAPFAARLTRRIERRVLMVIVGVLICSLSLFTLA
jgi:hypothetical protein